MAQNQKQPETTFVQSDWASFSDVHRFAHEAMATTFEVIVQHDERLYAQQAAEAAFDEVDRIENELSRYIENSDVARLNNLRAGVPLQLSLETFECLQISDRVHDQTGGAFDVTVGFLVDCWRDSDKQPRTPSPQELRRARERTGMNLLMLDETTFSVMLTTSPVRIDLGGVGKGYGVDRMAALLREWSVDRAMIHGGYSSVLALDAPKGTDGWPIRLSHPNDRGRTLARLCVARFAVSGSGLEKGRHIIDPRVARPVEGKIAAWSIAPDAATGDALSTAFMVMSPEEILACCRRHPEYRGLVIVADPDGPGERIISAGRWEPDELVT
jgi:thiamine biosynthesis lipoprotein